MTEHGQAGWESGQRSCSKKILDHAVILSPVFSLVLLAKLSSFVLEKSPAISEGSHLPYLDQASLTYHLIYAVASSVQRWLETFGVTNIFVSHSLQTAPLLMSCFESACFNNFWVLMLFPVVFFSIFIMYLFFFFPVVYYCCFSFYWSASVKIVMNVNS